MRRIGIIGGGPGGLMTGYFLQQQADTPYRLTLFEASARLGGKIHSPAFQTVPATYEAGAAELYDYSHLDDDPLRELVEELGLPTVRLEGAAAFVGDAAIANLDDLRDRFGPAGCEALRNFDRQAHDLITPQEFFHAGPEYGDDPLVRPGFDALLAAIPHPGVRGYVEHAIKSDLAVEPAHTSVAYGLHNYLMNDPAYMSLYALADGNEALPRALASRLDAEVRTGCRATAIARAEDGRLVVAFDAAAGRAEERFDFVVLALPLAALGTIGCPDPRLAEAMARHRADYNHPAHYLRVTVAFREPFWHGRLADSFCMLDRFGGCCLYDEGSRAPGRTVPALGWLIAGAAAESLASRSDDELVALALAALPEPLAHGRALAVEAKVHRWIGAVNAVPGGYRGRALDRRHQPEPVRHSNLFVVGDYLFDSTLNGVLDSAEYVAQWLAALLAEETANPA